MARSSPLRLGFSKGLLSNKVEREELFKTSAKDFQDLKLKVLDLPARTSENPFTLTLNIFMVPLAISRNNDKTSPVVADAAGTEIERRKRTISCEGRDYLGCRWSNLTLSLYPSLEQSDIVSIPAAGHLPYHRHLSL